MEMAFAKADVAKSDINKFDREVREFFRLQSEEIVTYDNIVGNQVWAFKFPKPPLRFNVQLGQILHALRSSLDNLAAALAIANNKSTSGVYFPIARSEDAYKSDRRIRDKVKKLPASAIPIIDGLKPYKGGNDLLWLLHDSNRDDKHPSLGVLAVGSMVKVAKVYCLNGDLLRLGPQSGGEFLVKDPNGRGMIQTNLDRRPHLGKVGDVYCLDIRCDGPREQVEFAETAPGAQMTAELDATLSITFTQIEGLKGKQAVVVLNEMCDMVQDILATFDREFFA